MGRKSRTETEEAEPCLSETLLFATMCIIGLPVDVHIRDGSVYSGTFHTASVEKDFGVVLKEARLTKKGKCSTNVATERVIETLVILSGDLVQVVAKGVQFPADGIVGCITGDAVESAVTNSHPSETVLREAKDSKKSTVDKKFRQNRSLAKRMNGSTHGFIPTNGSAGKENEVAKLSASHVENVVEFELEKNVLETEESSPVVVNGRWIEDDWSQGDQENHKQNVKFQGVDEVQSSSSILDSRPAEIKSFEDPQGPMKVLPNEASCHPSSTLTRPDNQCQSEPASTPTAAPNGTSSSGQVVDAASESNCNSLASSTDTVSPKSSESNRSSKEFKLNPGAKIFCPSFANPLTATPPTVSIANMPYVQSNSPIVSVAASQPECGIGSFMPRSSLPAKFAPYSNLSTGNGGNGSQFSQSIIGNLGNRTPPLRYASQYPVVQSGTAYVPPNSQAVMVGRMGQLVYVQPVPHDLVQSTAAIPPAPARPLLTPHQVQYPPKHPGTVAGQAFCMPPPFAAGGQQPLTMTTHIPVLQPTIPVNRPISVSGSNALYNTKFP